MGFMPTDIIASNAMQMVPDATVYHFGILTSLMHMAWVRIVCGRLKSDYRYSNTIVYNNFPWPDPIAAVKRQAVEVAAQAVLDARAAHPGASLAVLYNPTTMPPDLAKAHSALDRTVDRCYRTKPFSSERERVEFLFARYRELTEPLMARMEPARKRRR